MFQDEAEDGGEYGKYGRLKIGDFGLTRFHHPGTTGVSPRQVMATQTYRPPEYDLEEKVSRPFDIWSLGCLYLEFTTWLLLGGSAIGDFDHRRLQETTNPSSKGDNYFNIWNSAPRRSSGTTITTATRATGISVSSAEETASAGGAVAEDAKQPLMSTVQSRVTRFVFRHVLPGKHPELKRSVIEASSDFRRLCNTRQTANVDNFMQWIHKLRKDRNCSPFLKDLLDHIRKDMLVVNPKKRATCDQVVKKLQCMVKKCQKDNSGYLGSFGET